MKKHENAIKMLMKNAIDTKTLYGWYEDGNGARLMTNGHLIIKLSDTTLDYVGDFQKMNDKNNNRRLVSQMNDIVELAKKGEYKTAVSIQDIKVFDRYNTDKKPFINKYSDNSYIGFNPYYFNKINILTGSDLLTITDSKNPIYIAGDDIECVLLPVSLDKNYNSDNYAVFLEELKACYIQDEETKKEKATKKANKAAGIIPTLQPNEKYNGFTMSFYGVDYFMLSDAKRITKCIITEFIKAYCKRNKFSDTVLNDMLNSKIQLDNIKARIEKATFILNTNANNSAFTYIDIKTKYAFNGCMYFECDNKLVLIGCLLPTSTEAKEETPKTATIQDNTADVMSATATDTANNGNVTATKDITNELAFDTYPIIHNDNVVKKGGYYINKGNYDYIIIQNDFSGVYILYNLNYMHICGTNKDYFETVQDAINYLNAMDQETYFKNLKHLSVEEIYSIYKKYTPCQYHVIRQYIDKWNIKADTMQADARQDTTQDKPHKTSAPAVSLFVVTDKPEPVKLPGYELPTLDRIPTHTQRIVNRFKPLKSHRVYNNRVKDVKALKNGCGVLVGTVSANRAECAGGMLATVNTS